MKTLTYIIALTLISGVALADPVGGPVSAGGLLRPGERDEYSLLLWADQTTVVEVRGDGDGDIDCYLFDDNGNLVDSDTDLTDTCVIRVSPRWAAAFLLRLRNHGRISSAYSMRAY